MADNFEFKPTLCLDFDGVIHSYSSGWQGADVVADPPVDGALEFLREAIEYFDVQVYSSRSHQDGGIPAMQEWLLNRYEERYGDDDVYHLVFEAIGWPDHKPAAMVTIDDRALTFDGTWPAMHDLKAFKPWNKKDAS